MQYEKFSSLGDSLVNFIYSLAISEVKGTSVSKRAPNRLLSKALVNAGLRKNAKTRMDRHSLADYAEGLIFYAWKNKYITIEECVDILSKNLSMGKDEVQAFSELLKFIRKKIHEQK